VPRNRIFRPPGRVFPVPAVGGDRDPQIEIRGDLKILFDHHTPFALAHGGFPQQLAETKAALERAGVETDYVRWWDSEQTGDIIHFFGRPGAEYISFAHGRGRKVVLAELLTATGSRSRLALAFQKSLITASRTLLPATFVSRLAWDSYRLADACVALTRWEARLMHYLFGALPERTHVVPNGVEKVFFESKGEVRGQWLVCTATLAPRKRVLELAEAAVAANVPLWIIGKAYADTDPYAQNFLALAKEHRQVLRYEGAIADRERLARVYREARGFVLLSAMESLSLSALEAAACGCPLLLSDLPWARETFASQASYCPLAGRGPTAAVLKQFYENAPALGSPARPATWDDVTRQLKAVYEGLLRTSR